MPSFQHIGHDVIKVFSRFYIVSERILVISLNVHSVIMLLPYTFAFALLPPLHLLGIRLDGNQIRLMKHKSVSTQIFSYLWTKAIGQA